MNSTDDIEAAGLDVLANGVDCGAGMVRDPVSGDLFVFNHLEYDAWHWQMNITEMLPRSETALPLNYFPNDDPAQSPVNNWRPSHAYQQLDQ